MKTGEISMKRWYELAEYKDGVLQHKLNIDSGQFIDEVVEGVSKFLMTCGYHPSLIQEAFQEFEFTFNHKAPEDKD